MLQYLEDWAVIDQETVNLNLQPGMANAVIFPETGNAHEYWHLIKAPNKMKWSKVVSNNIGRLLQGIGYIKGTNTCFSIHKNEVP